MYTAVGMAIREHNNDLAKQLIQHPDCDVNAEAGDLGYPIHIAIVHQKIDIIQMLLNRNADPNVTDDKGNSPMHKVIMIYSKNGSISYNIIKMLISHGAEMNIMNRQQRLPIMVAIEDKKREAIKGIL